MDKNELIPSIRFPQYDIPWEQHKLGDICRRVQGNDGNMDLPTLTISAAEGWLDQRDRFNRNIAGKEQKNYTQLRKNQLSYNHGNSKLAKYGVVFALKEYEHALVPRVYHSFDVSDKADPDFIESMFASKKPDNELAKLISSGARMDGLLNINYDSFMGINIKIPSIHEQNKISDLLNTIEHLISLNQDKLDILKQHKKGLMQKLFPKEGQTEPDIRFVGFTDLWEQRKLYELGEIMTGSTPSTTKSEYYSEDGLPWVTPSDIVSNIISDTPKKLSEEGAKVGRIVPANTILCTCIASIGKNALLTVKGSFNQQINSLTPNDNNDPYFLLTESEIWSNHMKKIAASGTMQIVNKTEFSELTTMVPTLDEQVKIGGFFEMIDKTITLHQRKLDAMKEYKKGLLQQMFI